jgi:hypothetical protein
MAPKNGEKGEREKLVKRQEFGKIFYPSLLDEERFFISNPVFIKISKA